MRFPPTARWRCTEEQDIVYREAAKAIGAVAEAGRLVTSVARHVRRIVPDPTQLFRFSALTFNAHRIHYDRDYARDVEFYPGLVVQGPYIATLLMDHLLRHDAGGAASHIPLPRQEPACSTRRRSTSASRARTTATISAPSTPTAARR